jgi:hypothetical protein
VNLYSLLVYIEHNGDESLKETLPSLKSSIKRSSIKHNRSLGVVSRRADQQFSSVMESIGSNSQEHFPAFTSDLVKPGTKHHTGFLYDP